MPDYNSLETVVWRSRRFSFLNGTYDANSGTWSGTWMEVLEQSTDVASGVHNPYRDKIKKVRDDVESLVRITNGNTTSIGDLSTSVFLLNRSSIVYITTSAYTLLTTDSGMRFTNEGSAVDVEFTLPAIEVGLKYMFTSSKLADTSILSVITSDSIIYEAEKGDTMTLAGKGSFTLEALNSTEWFVTSFENSANITLS
jgi:hypothetical protein